jgi:hypothetical protein
MGKIKLVNLSSYTSPNIEIKQNAEYVTYGENNSYFQYLIDRYTGSPTNNAIINGVSQMVFGKGLDATDSSNSPNEYAQMVSLLTDEVIRKLAYDLKLMGQCAIQVAYNTKHDKILKVGHIPVETLAMEVCDKEDGEIKGFYYCADWSDVKPNEDLPRIPAFGTSKEKIEILYVRPYVAGHYFYSPVDYQGGLQYAELEEEISNYHLNNIMQGLAPSMLINFNNGVPNEEERSNIENSIKQKFQGSSNAGKFILSFNENAETASSITPVQLSDAHNQYQFLSDESMKKIMVAHRVVSPMLLGIKDNTGLGNNSDELKTASTLMDNVVIRPIQELLLSAFDEILAFNGISLDLYFKTLQPLEFADLENAQSGEQIEKETGEKADDATTVNDVELGVNVDLSDEGYKAVLSELKGDKMSDEWEEVDSRDYDEENLSADDWANICIAPKKSMLTKLKNEIYAKPNGFSYLDSKNYKIRYRYFKKSTKPSNKSRDFCSNMMRLSRSNVVYRLEDIDRASRSGVNKELGHKGQAFDLFKFKGGIYCRHAWKEVLYRLKKNTTVSDDFKDFKKTGEIPKTYKPNPRGSKQAKTAPVNMPNQGAYPTK